MKNIERTELGVWLLVPDAKPKEKRKRVKRGRVYNQTPTLI